VALGLALVLTGGIIGLFALQSSPRPGPSAIQRWVRHVQVADASILNRDFHAFINPPAHSSRAHLHQLCVVGRRDLTLVARHQVAPYWGVRERYARVVIIGESMYFNCLAALDHHSRKSLNRIHGLVLKFRNSATTFDRFGRRFHVGPLV
jgi:hypothetical protein